MKTKLLTLVVTLTLGIILAGSLLMPVISDAQKDLGDPITLTNNSTIVLREITEGDILQCDRTVVDTGVYSDKWTLNGDTITGLDTSTLSWNVGLISDAIYLQITSGGTNTNAGLFYDMTRSVPNTLYIGAGSTPVGDTATWKITVNADTLTITDRLGNNTDYSYTWGYVVCNYEDGEYYSAETSGYGICKSAEDLILCGAYTTGDLDTMYAYIQNEGYVSNSSYTMTVNADLTRHEGTTDINDIVVSVKMSDGENDETFTPYRIFLPYEVSGHATSGAAFNLLGAIPIIVIIGIVLAAMSAIALRDRD